MARYVNADKLLEYLEKEAESDNVKYSFIGAGVQATISVIKTFPLEDVKPVVHAYWFESYWGGTGAKCSNCNYLIHACDIDYQEVKHDFEYCPYCGAKMDGDVDG